MSNLLKAYVAALSIHELITGYETPNWGQAQASDPLCVATHPKQICSVVAEARLVICRHLLALTDEEHDKLDICEQIHTASGRLRGALFGYSLSEEEQSFIATQKVVFESNWQHAASFTAFVILSFYYQPFELPLCTNIIELSRGKLHRYLYFVMRQPNIMQDSDEDKYITYYTQMTTWLLDLIVQSDNKAEWAKIPQLVSNSLTLGTCYYIDRPIAELIKVRAAIVYELTKRLPDFEELAFFTKSSKPAAGRTKLRLGIISRNLGDYTDTRALYGLFNAFDPARYEIYWYSLDILDPTTLTDVSLFRKLFRFVHKAVSLRGNGAAMAQEVLNDDLDILAIGSAYSFGAAPYDQMRSCKLARIQIGLNAMIPGSSGFASYDYYLIPDAADTEAMANYRAESNEALKIVPDPLVWYEKLPATKPDSDVTRDKLGIPENAIVYCTGAAANKQMPGTLATWLNILREVPNSYLLFFPFNPAWGGYFIGLTFLARLNALLEQYPDIDPKRLVVVRQVTPEEGNRLIMLSDIYLGSFPHGGATSVMLALRHGKPVVARRTPWLRGTSDPSLLKSVGLEELIGRDNDEVTSIGIRLGLDASYRSRLSRTIAKRVENAPFFDAVGNSKRLQAVFDEIATEHNLLPAEGRTLKIVR